MSELLKVVDGDVLDVTSGVIAHQVNCMGVMGSGVARALRDRYPILYEEYKRFCEGNKPEWLLGMIQMVQVTPELQVANLFGQRDFGRDPGRVYTDYAALSSSWRRMTDHLAHDVKVAVPYGLGCGLGGGDWTRVSRILASGPVFTTAYKLTDV